MARNKNLVVSLEKAYDKFPPLPVNFKELIVAVAPWLTLVFGVLGLFGSLAAFGVSGLISPLIILGGGVGTAGGMILASVFGLISSVFLVVSFPGLLNRKLSGWNFVFWAEVVSVLSSVILFSLGGILVALIGFYFLFQVKEYYK